jgi:hypothetical protein
MTCEPQESVPLAAQRHDVSSMTRETREEALALIRDAIEFHIDGLRKAGQAIPRPSSTGEVAELPNLRHPLISTQSDIEVCRSSRRITTPVGTGSPRGCGD